MPLTSSLEIMLIAFLVAAVFTDFRDHRIPNVITLFAAAVGIVSHLYLTGLQGLGFALGGLAVGLACLLPFYLLGGMGAGDVKLMAAIGTFLGPQATVLAAAVGLLFGAIGAVGIVLWSVIGEQQSMKRDTADHRLHGAVATAGGPMRTVAVRENLKARFPYALALAVGAVASLIYLSF
jgi:prepilin peptidase CpaA